MPTSAGLFDTWQDAERAVAELERRGFSRESINLVGRDDRDAEAAAPATTIPGVGAEIAARAGMVAAGGAAIGGMTGLLAGLSIFALPGIGPVLGAGAVMTMLGSALAGAGVGAAAGGVIGALYGMGVAEEDAAVYAEGISRGKILVAVDTDKARVAEAEEVLRRAGAADLSDRRGQDEVVTTDKDPATIIGDFPPYDDNRR